MDKMQQIAELVSATYGVSIDDMRSKSRKRDFVIARQVAMYLIRRSTVYSLDTVGGWFGGRDHSTVIHAEKSVGNMVEIYREYRDQINGLLRVIRADICVEIGDGSAIHNAPSAKEIYITVNPVLT